MPTYAHTLITTAAATYEYTIGFSYAQTDDIKVYLDSGSGEVEIARGSATNQWVYSSSGTKITLGSTVGQGDGDTLRISRVTDISTAPVTFTDGSGITDDDLNKAVNALRYSIDELQVPAYEAEHTLAAAVAGNITRAHNFGAIPTRLQVWMECTSTDAGFAAGQYILAPLDGVYVNSTNIYLNSTIITNWTIVSASTGAAVTPNSAKWSIHVRAWR